MLDPQLGEENVAATGEQQIQAGRPCDGLRIARRDDEPYIVWPAHVYELLKDREFDLILSVRAVVDGIPIATAHFSEVRINAPLPRELFRADPPEGVRWRTTRAGSR